MKDLKIYLIENEYITEGLFKSSIGLMYIKKLDSEYILNGILNMYEYIIDKSDIKLFYKDFPIKERPFWENIYKLYENKIWSIFDVSKSDGDMSDQEDEIGECFDEENALIKVTPEFRRQLRNIIAGSSLKDDNLTAAVVDKIMLIDDPQFDKRYIFTINKIQGMFKRMFKTVDVKFLEKLFEKISNQSD